MINKLRLVFYFYSRFLLPSLFFNFLLVLMAIDFEVSFMLKVLFFTVLVFVYLTTRQKEKLTFYQNFSMNRVFLFGISFLTDIALLTAVYLIFGYVT